MSEKKKKAYTFKKCKMSYTFFKNARHRFFNFFNSFLKFANPFFVFYKRSSGLKKKTKDSSSSHPVFPALTRLTIHISFPTIHTCFLSVHNTFIFRYTAIFLSFMPIIVNHQHLIISIDSLSSPILSSTVACLSLNKPFQVIHSIMLFCLHIAYLTTNNRIADHSQQHIVTRNSLFITKNLLNNLKNPF